MIVTTGNEGPHPPAPKGWIYWYTYYWDTNLVHELRAENHYLLYLDNHSEVVAELRPNEKLLIAVQEVPIKLYVYRRMLVPASEEDLSDPFRLDKLTRFDPESK